MRVPAVAAPLTAAAVLLGGCTAPAGATPAPATAPAKARNAARGVRGRITAENGTTWTVTNARGKAFTVTLTPQTAFGTKGEPATQAQFPVGTQVRVAGTVDHGTVTATRVATAAATPTPTTRPTA